MNANANEPRNKFRGYMDFKWAEAHWSRHLSALADMNQFSPEIYFGGKGERNAA